MAVEASWNGHQWVTDDGQVVSSDPNWGAESSSGALSRGAQGFAETTPFNPMNWISMLKDLPGTAKSLVVDPLKSAGSALGNFKDTVTGGDPQGRLAAFEKGVTNSVGAIPLVGQPILHNVSEKWADGDIAGGAGSVLGLASGALLPKAAGKVGDINPRGVVRSVGRGMEAVGNMSERVGGAIQKPAGVGALISAISHPGIAALEALVPEGMKQGGRLTQKWGKSLQGLEDKPGPLPQVADVTPPSVVDMGNVPESAGQLRPARFSEEVPTEPAGGWDNAPNPPRGLPPSPLEGQLAAAPEYVERYPTLERPAEGWGGRSASLDGLMEDGTEPTQFDVVGDEPGMPQEQPMSADVDSLTEGMLQDEPAPAPEPGFDLGNTADWGNPLDALDSPQDAPAAPSPELPASLAAFEDGQPSAESGPSYTDWSQGMDDIINSATEADMPRQHAKGLGSSRPTNAIKDWVNQRQAQSLRDNPNFAREIVR